MFFSRLFACLFVCLFVCPITSPDDGQQPMCPPADHRPDIPRPIITHQPIYVQPVWTLSPSDLLDEYGSCTPTTSPDLRSEVKLQVGHTTHPPTHTQPHTRALKVSLPLAGLRGMWAGRISPGAPSWSLSSMICAAAAVALPAGGATGQDHIFAFPLSRESSVVSLIPVQ